MRFILLLLQFLLYFCLIRLNVSRLIRLNQELKISYSSISAIDTSGFGYEHSYLQNGSILDALLLSYSDPKFSVSSSTTPVDLGGFVVYLLDNTHILTADALCGTTTG
ncbi:hypothetical protein F8M41_016341 [Gigaspora margarita]|uniref:Uncharacterized protein n=1 Tax=Gigaspora margarita TaxID=4874 RepID=A0A8H4APF5_GIGMA|nr:hypothetical protein F8M41_016341 [Gigaspora margarita]